MTLERCIGGIRAWAQEAEPLIRRWQQADDEAAELSRWRVVVAQLAGGVRRSGAGGCAPVRPCRPGCWSGPPAPRRSRCRPALHTLLRNRGRALHAGRGRRRRSCRRWRNRPLALKGQALDLPAWLRRRHGARRGRDRAPSRRAGGRGRRRPGRACRAGRASPPAHAAGGCAAAAVGAGQRARAGVRHAVLLDHRLDQHRRRGPARAGRGTQRRTRAAAPAAAAARHAGAAAAGQPGLGAPLRGLLPRPRHALGDRGRPQRAAGAGGAADVRLHVRRRRPGPGHRRRRLCAAQALAAGAAVHRRRPRGPVFGFLFGSVFSLHLLPAGGCRRWTIRCWC